LFPTPAIWCRIFSASVASTAIVHDQQQRRRRQHHPCGTYNEHLDHYSLAARTEILIEYDWEKNSLGVDDADE